jgi:hypothetical protein
VLLVLRAFASGSMAMTGIEAISNAVPAFEPVEWRNARITLSWMIGLLIGMFAGVLVITRLAGIVPVASQTMLSQLAHLGFGGGALRPDGVLAVDGRNRIQTAQHGQAYLRQLQ